MIARFPFRAHCRKRLVFLVAGSVAATIGGAASIGAEFVIHISVDGLNSTVLQSLVDAGQAPNFQRFEDEGAWTVNARADHTFTTTLPGHTTIITGRPVLEPEGMPGAPFHHWTSNTVPRPGMTLHQNGYIPSVFDVVHDAGRSTAMFASKDKFVLYDQSYDGSAGAPHKYGRDKIDTFFAHDDGPPQYSQTMNERFIAEMGSRHFNYVFVHYRDPDSVGHVLGWHSSTYREAVRNVDDYIRLVFRLVESDPKLVGKTVIILTSDHGGTRFGHSNPRLRTNFTVPVLVWGAGVVHGDLYALNADSRRDPGDERIGYAAQPPTIRNGDTGNLALSLLGLGPIPTSLINAKQDLRVALPGDYNLDGTVDAADEVLWRTTTGSKTDLRADGNHNGRVDQADYDLWRAHFGQTIGASESSR
jgi:Type I phosphodiesterase / nucleotide pyrophosphatase